MIKVYTVNSRDAGITIDFKIIRCHCAADAKLIASDLGFPADEYKVYLVSRHSLLKRLKRMLERCKVMITYKAIQEMWHNLNRNYGTDIQLDEERIEYLLKRYR